MSNSINYLSICHTCVFLWLHTDWQVTLHHIACTYQFKRRHRKHKFLRPDTHQFTPVLNTMPISLTSMLISFSHLHWYLLVLHLTTLIATLIIQCRMSECLSKKGLQQCGREPSWPKLTYCPRIFLYRLRNPTKTSVKMLGVSFAIRTTFPNTNQKS
jgi:hypothetical protein